MKVKLLPQEDQTNGWSAILAPRKPSPALARSVKADWLVIGAGYAGLGAARRLAELRPNDSIVVVDAGIVGENASGRNSGFAIDLPHNVGSSLAELEKAVNYKRLLQAGTDSLEKTVREHSIDCQWSRRGKYHCAVSEDVAEQTITHHVDELKAMGEAYEVLDKRQLAKRLGTSYFHTGIYTPGCVLMNPAALTRGLADTLPPNVTVYENSPVLELDFGSPVRARTDRGEITASQVIVANNGFAQQFGLLSNKMFPMVTFASLTPPLTKEQQTRLAAEGEWGVTPANAVTGATMRYTQDHRILIRQEFVYAPAFRVSHAVRERARLRHKRVFDARFPMLPEVQMQHFWMGTVMITRNGAPGWGRVAPNAYLSVGCNGVGVVKQTIAGSLLGDLATGNDNALITDMLALGQPNRMPPQPFLGIGIQAFLAKERWVGRGEY
ncbi:MAG: NAD(P)/FAD-dependent oxidoreductase [Polaromonas sp.]